MATQTQTIPLTAISASGTEPGLDSTAAPALPPLSRKKQAAVIISAFGSIVLTFGYNQTYGVFQEYYLSSSQDVLVPSPASQASPPTAMLAFVGTLCYGLTWAGGIVVNPVISRIEHGTWAPITPSTRRWRCKMLRLLTPKTITISGILMVSVGFTLASFCRSMWQLLLTQGLIVGFGMSLLYFPFLAPAPEYFTNHRATAMGFVSVSRILRRHYTRLLTPHFLDPGRRRHRRSRLRTRHPYASQLRRGPLDPTDLRRLQPGGRVAHRLGGAAEPFRVRVYV